MATTGLVAGFMVSHALVLGRFLDWLVTSGPGVPFASTYPAFAGTAGRSGLALFYGLCGMQVVAALAFLVVAVGARRERVAAAIAGVAAVLWPAVHYGSGFGAVEQAVLRSLGEVSGGLAARFVAWNVPIHVVHAAILTAGLGALLSVPMSAIKRS
ncbi:MAG: hypothetical protein ACREJV_12690 [Candidatus Rokuibacteriota bacterium]